MQAGRIDSYLAAPLGFAVFVTGHSRMLLAWYHSFSKCLIPAQFQVCPVLH